ncbi:hypothetical protein CAPTEDRAFT_99895 [Capitella teleta]|uniref:Ribonuclease P protein subunit p20 n=1 Tax=Capitella teleta TaxID=283909 RepID=R7UR93_CAPTE|nr:hypothetical protein CAPTEDRAFT_99895 [Capitella teleta]|eukprot:ELU08628.1 hypothetical protein CAPTEDRAFT_99895 [Capitella teleta]
MSGKEIHLGRTDDTHESKDTLDPEEYSLRKRLPRKLPRRKNDVYVNSKTNFNGQMARCQKLLDAGFHEVYIHGLGVAINHAINIALQLKSRNMDGFVISANTSTVDVVDDFEPETEEGEAKTQQRSVSAIHIKVFHPQLSAEAQATHSSKTPNSKRKRKRQPEKPS